MFYKNKFNNNLITPLLTLVVMLLVSFCWLLPVATTTASASDSTSTSAEPIKVFSSIGNKDLRRANGMLFVFEQDNNHYTSTSFGTSVSYNYNDSSETNKFYWVTNSNDVLEHEFTYYCTGVTYFKGNYIFATERGFLVSENLSEFNYIALDVNFTAIDSNDRFVVAGTSGGEIYISENGTSWERFKDHSVMSNEHENMNIKTINSICAVGSDFYVYGVGGPTLSQSGAIGILYLDSQGNLTYDGNIYNFGIKCNYVDLIKGLDGNLYGLTRNTVTKLNLTSSDFTTGTAVTLPELGEEPFYYSYNIFDDKQFLVNYSLTDMLAKVYLIDNESATLIGSTTLSSNAVAYMNFDANALYFVENNTEAGTATLNRYELVENSFVVNFVNYNGELIDSQSVITGGYATAPTTTPTRQGYTFIGWDKDPSTTTITSNTTFVAQFERNNMVVTFKDSYGETIKTVEVPFNEVIDTAEIPTPPTIEGYIFSGWSFDLSQPITDNVSVIAQYTQNVKLIINYPTISGTSGLVNQFYTMSWTQYTITYTIGDFLENSTYLTFVEDNLQDWFNDFNDGYYNYELKFLGWDTTLPDRIYNNLTITANVEKLLNVRLDYYSQLRFSMGVDDYYYCFIGQIRIERLVESGYTIDLDYFKRPDVNYEIYNASRNTFYNNLEGFEFLGWDYDITKPITSNLIITGEYKMPTFNIKYYDKDMYLIDETNNEIDFITIEDINTLFNSAEETMNSVKESFINSIKSFFSLSGMWENIDNTFDNIINANNLNSYIDSVRIYHNASTMILTPFVVIDNNRPDVYGGIFTNGDVNVNSAVLQKFSGTAEDFDLSYWINPIMFATTAYPMTATVTYKITLDTALKGLTNLWNGIVSVFDWCVEYWWVLLIIALVIIFWKPIWSLFKLIGNAISRKIKSADDKNKQVYETNQRSKNGKKSKSKKQKNS